MNYPRIVFMQDLDPMSTGGGAQLNDREMIKEGLRRGHDIVILTPENQNSLMLDDKDFMILSNVARFDPENFKVLKNRYAIFHHDWWFQCRWRLYFPMTPKCFGDGPPGIGGGKTQCPQVPVWYPVLAKAALHIFLSPLHYSLSSETFGQAVEPHVMVPSAVNPDRFFDHQKPDRRGTCNVNGLMVFKGRENHVKYAKEHPDEQVTFLGTDERPSDPLPPNCKLLQELAEPMMPRFYNEFETYIELPATPQPFNRTCIPGRARVLTESGWTRIMDIKVGDRVMTHTGIYKQVTDVMSRSAGESRVSIRPRIKTRAGLNVLLVTENHPILTQRGWVMAKDLDESDQVAVLAKSCKGCGNPIYFRSEYCSQKCAVAVREYPLQPPKLLQLRLSDIELGRLVGIIDGEGCVSARVDTRGRGTFNSYVTVTNNDKSLLQHLQSLTGFGTIRGKNGGKRQDRTFVWWIERKDEIYTLLKTIAPLLIVKRRQAELVTNILEALKLDRASYYPVALESYKEIRSLNRRGMAVHANNPRESQIFASQVLEQKIATEFVYVRIRLRKYQPLKPHKVYNLEVEEDHSYVAQGIVVHNCVEAYLCGLKVRSNSLMGCLSWPWMKEGREVVADKLRQAPTDFWRAIESVL